MTDSFSLDGLIGRLEDWRQLPGYRLEPRLDAILAPYILKLLAPPNVDPSTWQQRIIPEFPVPRSIAKGDANPRSMNRMVHIDFLIVPPERNVQLVELKTDASDDAEQTKYLKRLAKTSVDKLIGNLVRTTKNPKSRHKYEYLLQRLESLGLRQGGRREVEVIYLAPSRVIDKLQSKQQPPGDEGNGKITFRKLAELVAHIPEGRLRQLVLTCDPLPESP